MVFLIPCLSHQKGGFWFLAFLSPGEAKQNIPTTIRGRPVYLVFPVKRKWNHTGLRRRNSAAIYGWDRPLLTFIYPGFDCGSNGGLLKSPPSLSPTRKGLGRATRAEPAPARAYLREGGSNRRPGRGAQAPTYCVHAYTQEYNSIHTHIYIYISQRLYS